jgi:hypothetical protein
LSIKKYILARLLSAIVGAGSGSRCAATTSDFVSHTPIFATRN